MARCIKLILLSVLIIALGFTRESVFVNINFHIGHLYYQTAQSNAQPFYQKLLTGLSYDDLYKLKWVMTFLFTISFYFLTTRTISVFYKTKKYNQLLFFVYLGLFIVSMVSYSYGLLFDEKESGYKFARIFMGALQSPFILLLAIPAIKLSPKP